MADNVVLNSGSGGATLSTDEVTRATVVQHVQYVKLMNGTDGAIDVIPGEATNGLDVDVTRVQGSVTVAQATASNLQMTVGAALPAGTNNIGDVDVLTVPAPLNLTGGGAEASALRVTLANDSTGVLSVDDNGGSLTVDGTVTANLAAGTNNIGDVDVLTLPSTTNAGATVKTTDYDTGAGTDTVTMFGIALPASGGAVAGGTSTNPVRTDPTGTTTQPVSGTVTANAGTGTFTVSGTVTANAGTGTFTVDSELPAAAALADATANPTTPLVGAALELFNGTTWDRVRGDTTNGVDVDVTRLPSLAAGTNNIGDVDVLTVPAPLSTTGGGTEATALRVTIASDSTGVVSVDDNGGSLTVDVGTALPAGTNNIGRINPEPQTANGLSISRTISAATTNATSAKGSAGQVYTIIAHNVNAAVRYLKLYNKATAPTVGTDTPVLTLPIPANTAGAGFVLDTGGMGIAFSLGIGYALTTGVTDADTGAVAANEIVVNILYK